jgi:hypothetical protein
MDGHKEGLEGIWVKGTCPKGRWVEDSSRKRIINCYLYILKRLNKRHSFIILGKIKPLYIKGVGHYGLEQPNDKIMPITSQIC